MYLIRKDVARGGGTVHLPGVAESKGQQSVNLLYEYKFNFLHSLHFKLFSQIKENSIND